MFHKRAEQKQTIQPLNKPNFSNSFIKDQNLIIDNNVVQEIIQKTAAIASKDKTGDGSESPVFDLQAEIDSHPDSLFVKCFAIKADEPNDNGDYFSKSELIKGTPTFVGVPLFTNHANSDINQARGKVVHSWWDEEKNGIMIIGRVDAVAYPQLARGIKEDYILGTSMGCITPECRVLMHDGTYLPISEVQPGDSVYTHTGNIKEVLNNQIRYKNEEIYKLVYEGFNSSLIITGNHPVLTLKEHIFCACGCGLELPKNYTRFRNWKNKYRKHFINGHSQNVCNSNPKSPNHTTENKKLIQKVRSYDMDDFEWKPVSELNKNDVVVFPIECNRSKKNQPTINQAKLIGYFLAEGSYKKYDNIRKEVNFSFCYSQEKDTYVPEVISLLKSCFGENISIWTQHRFPNNDVIIVCCHNSKVADWFYKYCGEYSISKKLPPEFISWSPKIQKTIIGTFINGDGCTSTRNCVHKNNNKTLHTLYTSISINSSSQKLIEQFSVALARCGIWHTIRANYDSKSIELKSCVGLGTYSVDRIFKGNEVTLNCHSSFEIVINQNYATMIYDYTEKNNKTLYRKFKTFSSQNDILITGPYLCRKIKQIEKNVYTGSVHNLQVKDDNSYIAEGVVVKNCQVQYSLCSACHNYAETPDRYCACIRERKTRVSSSKNETCQYFKNGSGKECPICGSTKNNIKKFNYNGKIFEYNYGIKFIENSFVTHPACSDCGVTEVIDPNKLRTKIAEIEKTLPRLLKAIKTHEGICTDKQCIKVAGQQEIDQLTQALDLISSVSKAMLNQKEQIDLEFLSDLVQVLADLQTVTDELTEQGYGRLQSPDPNAQPQQPQSPETPKIESGPQITNSAQPVNPTPGGGSKVHSGPAGQVGNVTSPLANTKKLNLEKIANNIIHSIKTLTLSEKEIIKKEHRKQLKTASLKKKSNVHIDFSINKKELKLLTAKNKGKTTL